MPPELDSDDSDVEKSPSTESQKYKVHSHLNTDYGKKSNRDIIDNMFSYINRDLLICKLFYFFFFAAFGSLFPLLAIYFKQLAMNPTRSGILIGFRPFVEFCSAPFWGSLADRYKKGKQLLLFSLLCWIVFTLAIAFVKPPHYKCIEFGNSTLHGPPQGFDSRGVTDVIGRWKRDVSDDFIYSHSEMVHAAVLHVQSRFKRAEETPNNYVSSTVLTSALTTKSTIDNNTSTTTRSKTTSSKPAPPSSDERESGGYTCPPHSTQCFKNSDIQDTFFKLLLLVVIGEFFSAPAITFVDSVTLAYLGEDTDNYGRQRMFGSLGWGVSMFFVGLALDHSSTFPNHPCMYTFVTEKNYTICFAVFSVLMSCAFITATQLKFDDRHGGGQDIQLMEIVTRVKDKVVGAIKGEKTDQKGIFKSDEDAEIGYLESKASESNLERMESQDPSYQNQNGGGTVNENGKNLHISLQKGNNDMVDDAVKASGYTKVNGPDDEDDEPFLGKWFAVLKMLATFRYISVLFISWFMGFGIGLIFTFLFWHLQDIGGSPTLFGVASVFNHVSELITYFFSRNIINRFGHVKILYAGLVGNLARFIYISLLENPWWVLPFEFVQGLTHAAVWAACCSYVTQAIPVGLRSSAQGILQGLHHGLGRGCGAVFGGLMVYGYGSRITFRIYGVTCLVVLVFYVSLRYLLEDRSSFSYGGKQKHERMEEESPTCHLAPHGVPSGMARDLSSSKLNAGYNQPVYGTASKESFDHSTAFLEKLSQGPEQQRDYHGNMPQMSTQAYQQQPQGNPNPFRP
ncbi:major facilitator superfamily domain-containing protein 6-A-like [Saccostrea cucullata]|uniref:major facilitator superfamily domain-containing protein 6-A-like n=1 Tax=Saccostrea cuccullata TaxID=36930 RepID=UPI002ED2037E